MIDYSPQTGTIRVFDSGASYGDPYKAIMQVLWHDKTSAEIQGAHGELTKKDLREIRHTLALMGATHMLVRRAVPHKVPLGVLLYEQDGFALWRIRCKLEGG